MMPLTEIGRQQQLGGQDPTGGQPGGQMPAGQPGGQPQMFGQMGPAPWQPYMPGQFGPGPSVVQPLFQTQPGFDPRANQYPWPGTPWGQQQSGPGRVVRELQRISRERAARRRGASAQPGLRTGQSLEPPVGPPQVPGPTMPTGLPPGPWDADALRLGPSGPTPLYHRDKIVEPGIMNKMMY